MNDFSHHANAMRSAQFKVDCRSQSAIANAVEQRAAALEAKNDGVSVMSAHVNLDSLRYYHEFIEAMSGGASHSMKTLLAVLMEETTTRATKWPSKQIYCGVCGAMYYVVSYTRFRCKNNLGKLATGCWNSATVDGEEACRRVLPMVFDLLKQRPSVWRLLLDAAAIDIAEIKSMTLSQDDVADTHGLASMSAIAEPGIAESDLVALARESRAFACVLRWLIPSFIVRPLQPLVGDVMRPRAFFNVRVLADDLAVNEEAYVVDLFEPVGHVKHLARVMDFDRAFPNRPFRHIADELGLSVSTVHRAFGYAARMKSAGVSTPYLPVTEPPLGTLGHDGALAPRSHADSDGLKEEDDNLDAD